MQTWLGGTVLGLLSLNLLALALFIFSLFHPQISKVIRGIRERQEAKEKLKLEMLQAKAAIEQAKVQAAAAQAAALAATKATVIAAPQATPSAPSIEASSIEAPPSDPIVQEEVQIAAPPPALEAPQIQEEIQLPQAPPDIEAPPAEVNASEPSAPPPPEGAASSELGVSGEIPSETSSSLETPASPSEPLVSENPATDSGSLSEPTEILEPPQELASAPSSLLPPEVPPDQTYVPTSEVTEVIAKEAPSLPQEPNSGMNESEQPMSPSTLETLKSIEESLDEAVKEVSADELSIFDPSTLDHALNENTLEPKK